MTLEILIAEGRRLQRDCFLLKPYGSGEPVAFWFEPDDDDISITEFRRWLTLDLHTAIPNSKAPIGMYLSLYTKGLQEGVIDVVDEWPPRNGVRLFAHPSSIIPPIDAIFARGSETVGNWLKANKWERGERYNSNFPDSPLVAQYQKLWFSEYPIFKDDPEIYAFTGGWHLPGQDDDWHDLIDDRLLVTTVRDSEPWVEAWQLRSGEFVVKQRIT